MDKIIPFPGERPDVTEMMVDGKLETMLSARGLVLFHLYAWKVDGNEKARNGIRRYCEYVTMHGYRGGAEKAFAELADMDKVCGIAWIKRTFAKYIQDQKALIQYMMN